MRTPLRLLAIAMPGIVLAATAGAQAGPASIPTPLATALLNDPYARGSSTTTFTVGEVPAGFPADLVPPSMTVLGGLSHGTRITVILRAGTEPPLAPYQRLLRERGFTAPPPAGGFGFASSGTTGDYVCRDSASVSATVLRDASDARLLSVTYNRNGGYNCARRTLPTPPGERPRLTLPLLPPPPGATSNGGGGGGGSTEVHATAAVTDGTRIATALARYYAGLLASEGWSTGVPVGDARLAALPLEAKDSGGRVWTGGLMVSSRGNVHTLTLRMTPPEGR